MREKEHQKQTGLEIAVIGMAGRFPGASNIDRFWENLVNGQESLWFLTPQELEGSGIAPRLYNKPNYVKVVGGILEGKEYFDASFFGYTPREAEIMDPQIRLFHECAWEALENAGCDPYSYDRSIGLFAGASSNFEWKAFSLLTGKSNEIGQFAADLFVEHDQLCSRVSYNFNLKGPGFFIGTACSTSLVAIHLACQALLSGECDMALAGGVSLWYRDNKGYLYEEGMIGSPDGHCRAFDAEAKGVIGGEGVGIVVLKRLQDAVHDRDTIGAVIKGSAINNDGNRKVGYTAPSVKGQAEVIRWALEMAEIEPGSIGYLETHGTGTTLGDPIEVGALIRAFQTDKKQFCRIGSVKTNVGHLGAAAGVAGFIKTVLILKNKLIPPSLHFNTPNPKIDFQNSPFYVNAAVSEWKDHEYPLRAGVSSFGIGGTNAHVILEEAPAETRDKERTRRLAPLSNEETSKEYQLILLSAKTPTALEQMTSNLAAYLKKNPGINIADAAYTLQVGRKDFKSRRKLICSSISEAAALLSSPGSGKIKTHVFNEKKVQVVFLFPGLGSQYVNMGRGLYESEPFFRQQIDCCFKILNGLLDDNIKEILYPGESKTQDAERKANKRSALCALRNSIYQTDIAQLVIFIFEYALAKLLMRWGIRPHAMMGYSFGEYAAACISGVFSLKDALKLVVSRGKLIRKLPPGVMMSVPLPREELTGLLTGNLAIAVDNGPSCIVSGPCAAVNDFEKQMKAKGFLCMRLRATHAIHSKMMDTILKEFEQEVENTRLKIPGIRYISNVTGQWLTGKEAVTPTYWVNHLRETVRFSDGINLLAKNPNTVFIEIGPGGDLTTLMQRHIQGNPGQKAVNLIKSKENGKSDIHFLLNKIGELWLYGVNINWREFHGQEEKHRKRIPLPTYPFEGQQFPTQGDPVKMAINMLQGNRQSAKKPDMADWFYIPSWKRTGLLFQKKREMPVPLNWLVFMDNLDCGIHLVKQLEMEEQTVITVKAGAAFMKLSSTDYTLNPGKGDEYNRLFSELQKLKMIPDHILHLWSITAGDNNELEIETVENALDSGYYSLFYLARALGKQQLVNEIKIDVITNNMQQVTGAEELRPEKAAVLGPVKTIPREYTNIKCRSLDVIYPPPGSGKAGNFIGQLLDQLAAEADNPISIAALRDNYRWEPVMEPVRLEPPNRVSRLLKEEGVYMLVGGTGGIGLELAKYLAKTVRARLALVGRTGFPAREEWEDSTPGRMTRAIRSVQQCEELAARVLTFRADVTNHEQMKTICRQVEKQLGPINGIIHCAGLPDGAMIQRRTRESLEEILASKVKGTLVLDQISRGLNLDFLILCSSLGSIVPAMGQVGYCAANAFLDSFAAYKLYKNHTNTFTVSINWDSWLKVGMAIIPQEKHEKLTGREFVNGMTASEGVHAFSRILGARLPHVQVAVSIKDLNFLIREAAVRDPSLAFTPDTSAEFSLPGKTYQRPELDTEYAAPVNKTQEILVEIWQMFFGIQPIGIRDNFFELKGDSLNAITVITRINRELDIKVPIVEFFDRATIEKIAAFIDENFHKSIYTSIEPAEKKEYYVLSSSQKRLYFLHQLDPGSTVYNMPQLVQLEGEFDSKRVEKAFTGLIKRHESMRTSFIIVAQEPVQVVHEKVEIEIEYDEVKVEGAQTGQEDGTESIIKHFFRPFDLSQAPLIRLGLIKKEEGKHILMVNMHHIVSDGTSNLILIRDFTRIYAGEEITVLRLQYNDYTRWQQRQVVTDDFKRQEEYWLNEFEGIIPVLNLPTDYFRPTVQDFEGNLASFEISMEETKSLKQMAWSNGSTLFMVLLALYNVFLSKISNQDDIIVGTPTAGRRHADLEKIIGIFVNMLVLRNYLLGEYTFKRFLDEIREKTLQAFENQDYYFEDLVEKIVKKRDISRNPLFNVSLELQNFFESSLKNIEKQKIKAFQVKPYSSYPNSTSKFDLSLVTMEKEGKLYFYFEYCTKLFEEETILRFIQYFKRITSSVIQYPGTKISDIEVISGQEKKRILYEFNDTEVTFSPTRAVHILFDDQVKRKPDNIAVVGPPLEARHLLHHEVPKSIALFQHDVQLTYNELNEKSNRLARSLKEKGVAPGIIVGILAIHSIRLIAGILGILKAGAAYLPVDPGYPQDRVKFIMADSNATILLNSPGTQVKVKEESTRIQGNHTIPSADGLAYVIYTSGSTGKPKGVMVEHRSVINLLYALDEKYSFSEKDTWLLKTACVFDVSITELFCWFMRGGKVNVMERGGEKDPQMIADTIARYQTSHINFVPSMFSAFAETLNQQDISQLSSLKYIFLAGEALQPETVNQFTALNNRIPLENLYGPTEATVYASGYSLQDWADNRNVPIGKPLPNVVLYITDKFNRFQPVGIPGELSISGAGAVRGYLNRPELTAEKFVRAVNSHLSLVISSSKKLSKFTNDQYPMTNDRSHSPHHPNTSSPCIPYSHHSPIYKTGDLARWLPDGNIEFLGRMDNQVKIRGFRVELEEIEKQLLKHDDIKKAVVIMKGNTKENSGNNYLCAYLVTRRQLDISQLRNYLSAKLPAYMIPSHFINIDQIPLTTTGKIDRRTLESLGENMVLGVEYVEPENELEKTISQIWKELLKLDKIGIHDNFFDLGGNSLNIISLRMKLNMKIGKYIPLVGFFRYPTIHSFAMYLENGETKVTPSQKKKIKEAVTLMEETMQLLIGD